MSKPDPADPIPSPRPVSPPESGPPPLIQALQESSRQILARDDFKETARVIYRTLKNLMGAAAGYVALLSKDGQGNDLLFLDTGGLSCAVDPSRPMPVRGLRSEAYKTGRVVYHNDFPHSPWAGFLPPKHVRLENVLFAPLKIQEKTVGLIGLANKPGGFSEADAQTAGVFGELAAVALANSRHLQLLRSGEEHFRTVAQTATDAIVSANGEGLILFWNNRAASLFGYTEAEIIGRPVTIIIPERLQERHCEALKRVRVTGIYHLVGQTIETSGRHRDGREIPIELSLSEWESGGSVHFTAIIRDITERKKAKEILQEAQIHLAQEVGKRTTELQEATTRLQEEMAGRQGALQALELSERRFRAIFNQSFQFIGLLAPDGTVLEINHSTLVFLNLKFTEVVGRPLWELRSEAGLQTTRQRIKEAVRAASRGRFVRFEFSVPQPAGHSLNIDFSIKPVFDEKRIIWLIVEGRDMTRYKQIEKELRVSEAQLRLLSSQVLMAQENERKRIAQELHDGIGQYLSAIKYRVEHALVRKSQTAGKEADFLQDMVPVIQEAIEEIRRICLDLRPSILDDLGIMATLSWFCREFQKTYTNIRIEQEISVKEEEVQGPLKIIIFRITQEALNNVAKHSRASTIGLTLALEDHRLCLEIKDNGRGFPVERVARGNSEGRGLGLAGMKERVELSGGEFQITSRKGKGTLIRAAWPR